MGVVYRAYDPQIDRMVALKVLRRDRIIGENFVQRFLKEARAIGRLSHPNIVTVFDVGNDRETVYIAEEFLDGQSLDEVYHQSLPDLQKIVDIGVKVAEALDYSHRHGIVHRDIKPSNIILTRDDQVKITDFGVARVEDPAATEMTQAGEIIGTPNYMSPEQVNSEPVDGRSDLYSLGVILYELSTGRRPYAGKNFAAIFHAILHQKPASPMNFELFVSRGLPPALSETLLKSIEKVPAKRFQSGADMAEALTCLTPSRTLVQTSILEKKTNRSLMGVLFVGLVLVSAGGGFLYFRQYTGQPQVETSVARATLKVTSNVPGAKLYVDNAFQGQTPKELKLPIGSYYVRLSLPGYYGWEVQIQLPETGYEVQGLLVPVEENE